MSTAPATTPTGNPTVDALIAAGMAIAPAFAVANPLVGAAVAVANEGIRFYTDMMHRASSGAATDDELIAFLEAAVARTDVKLDALRAKVEAAEAAGNKKS